MSDCFVHTFPGEKIELVKNPPEADDLQLAAEAIACLQEFDIFVQPLAVDLSVRCRDPNWLFVTEIEPSLPHWHLRTSSIPVGVSLESRITNPQVHEKSHLSPEVILDWLKTALDQDYLNPEIYRITWSQIYIESTRARIFDEKQFEGRQSLLLSSEVGELSLPLESRTNGFWVSGPNSKLPGEPPFTFCLTQEYGGLSAQVLVHWSLWTQPGSPGNIAIRKAISRLIDKGWEIFYSSSSLSPN
jgi:hypothetical protein